MAASSADTPASDAAAAAAPAVFRVPPAALVAVVFLAMGLSPIAFQGGVWFLLFLLPLALGFGVLWVRTTVDADGIRVRGAAGTDRLGWSQVARLRVGESTFVRAVPVEGAHADRELVMTCVRVRDLGRVGEASGGRISVPTVAEAHAAEEHRRELEAARMRIAQLREAEQDTAQDTAEDTADDAPDTDGPGRGRA